MKEKINLVLVNNWVFPNKTPHFGLMSLAAYVRQSMPEVEISIVESLDPEKEIIQRNPDIVGFTSDTLAFTRTLDLAKRLKKSTKAVLIIGGVHITAMPESLGSTFDLGIVGEGEITLLEVLKLYRDFDGLPKEGLTKIDGLVFLKDNSVCKTSPRELIKNIDDLPYPARDLTPMEELYLKDQLNLYGVKRMANVMTSRGCPYSCIFCGSPVQWGRVRFHSAQYVVNEIKYLVKKYKLDAITFWDDLFITPLPRLKAMLELLKTEGLGGLTFFGYARANLINDESCKILKQMGVKKLIFGLESGSQRMLGYLKRNSVTTKDNERAVELCRKYGITSSSGYITGTPGETLEELKMTYSFMKKHPLDNTQIYILTPYPGTEIWRYAKERGLVSDDMDFGKLFVQLKPLGFLDFFKRSNQELLKDRIFLNTELKNNQEYLDTIFKMHKLATLQNLWFYLKTIPRDPELVYKMAINWVYQVGQYVLPGKIEKRMGR